MRRLLSAALSALDALALITVGVGIVVVPATLVWAVQFGVAANFLDFWRTSVNIWLVGHGVDITLSLDPVLGALWGVPDESLTFVFQFALLGFALVSFAGGWRAGRRIALADSPIWAATGLLLTSVVLSLLLALSSASPAALPSRPQAALFPALIIGAGALIGLSLEQIGSHSAWWMNLGTRMQWNKRTSPLLRRDLAASLRGGCAIALSLLTFGGLAVAALLALNYATVVGLYQNVQAGVWGGIALTVGQLMVLPNLVVWAASWMTGAGFSVGAGSVISPSVTLAGPIPSIPVLGALPSVSGEWGFAVLIVPALLSFIFTAIIRQRHDRFSSPARSNVIFTVATGTALVCAGILSAFAWMSSGAIGPGRLSVIGPDPLAVALWSFVIVFVGAVVGGYAGRVFRRP